MLAAFVEHIVEVKVDAQLAHPAVVVGIEGVGHIIGRVIIGSVFNVVVELAIGNNVGNHRAVAFVVEVPLGIVTHAH